MNYFPDAFKFLISHEGDKYVDVSGDKGGPTKYGISLRFVTSKGITDIDNNKDGKIDSRDIRSLTLDQAASIYEQYFWTDIHLNDISNKAVATKVFDTCVNMGPAQGIKILQEVLNGTVLKDKQSMRLQEDGVIGNLTISELNALTTEYVDTVILPDYRYACWEHYKKFIAKNPSQQKFANDWKRRAFS